MRLRPALGKVLRPVPSKEGLKRYKEFHGKAPKQVKPFAFPIPKDLICLASPEFITYISDKLNGGGTGKVEKFRHKFDKSTLLFTNEKGNMLIIMGPKLKVTRRGIVG